MILIKYPKEFPHLERNFLYANGVFQDIIC